MLCKFMQLQQSPNFVTGICLVVLLNNVVYEQVTSAPRQKTYCYQYHACALDVRRMLCKIDSKGLLLDYIYSISTVLQNEAVSLCRLSSPSSVSWLFCRISRRHQRAGQLEVSIVTMVDMRLAHGRTECQDRYNSSSVARKKSTQLAHRSHLMHLSILCPTTPCTGKGGANGGFDFF